MKDNLRLVRLGFFNKLYRVVWNLVWLFLFRPSPTLLHGWRRLLVRLFGAKVESNVHLYPSVKIWSPKNLILHKGSCLSHHVDCYNVGRVVIGEHAIVSQNSVLCTATHDYTSRHFPLLVADIYVGARSWVTSYVFVAPGVTIGEGAVVNAGSCVFSDIEAWTVAKGNPAIAYKVRYLRD